MSRRAGERLAGRVHVCTLSFWTCAVWGCISLGNFWCFLRAPFSLETTLHGVAIGGRAPTTCTNF